MAEATADTKPKRDRKPNARDRKIIFGAIDERVAVLMDFGTPETTRHLERIRELIDELRRSVSKEKEEATA